MIEPISAADALARSTARLYELADDCARLAHAAALTLAAGDVNLAADAADAVLIAAADVLADTLAAAGAITRPRAEAVGAGWLLHHATRRLERTGGRPRGGRS